MKTIFAILCLAATASALGQQTSTAPETSPATHESPLVKAAKANGGLKKPIPKKTIKNADVKKSNGKIIELSPKEGATAAPPAAPPTSSLAAYEEQRKTLAAAEKRVAAAELKVGELEKDLARIEQSYYEAADPNYRDSTVAPRFAQTKSQLDEARRVLADARDALSAITPKPRAPETAKPQ